MLCQGSILKFDLYLGGKLLKRDDEMRLLRNVNPLIYGSPQDTFDIAQLIRAHIEITKPLRIQYFTAVERPLTPIPWYELNRLSTLNIDCNVLRDLRRGYLAINLVTEGTLECNRASSLFVDLFSNGQLIKENALLTLVYDKHFLGGTPATDLLEAARLTLKPRFNKIMGRIYIADKVPQDRSLIPWSNLGTYVTDDYPALTSCAYVLEYQQKYVAINIAPACKDTTLAVHLFWRGEPLRAIAGEEDILPIHFRHGEEVFGESTVDLAEAARDVILKEMPNIASYDTRVQFFSDKLPPRELLYWKSRKAPSRHLIKNCDQIRQLKDEWVAINVEPVILLKCEHCSLDAVFHHRASNLFFCSLQCYNNQ